MPDCSLAVFSTTTLKCFLSAQASPRAMPRSWSMAVAWIASGYTSIELSSACSEKSISSIRVRVWAKAWFDDQRLLKPLIPCVELFTSQHIIDTKGGNRKLLEEWGTQCSAGAVNYW